MVLLDIDAGRQPLLAADNVLGLRWRCAQSHIAPAIADALTTNYTGLGWSAAFVQPLLANLTGCRELALDDLHGATLLPPLATALATGCPEVGDPDRPWEPARSAVPLRVLDLEGSLLEDAGAAGLGPMFPPCPTLEAVHAPANRISDDGARALAAALYEPPHPGVRLLDLHGNNINDYGADGLARLLMLPAPPRTPVPLAELRIHRNRITAIGFRLLAEGLRDNVLLTTLMLSGNPGGDAGVVALADALVYNRHPDRPSALRRLYLTAVNISDVGARALLDALSQPNSPPLEALVLDGNPMVSAPLLEALEAVVSARRATIPALGEQATGLFRVAIGADGGSQGS